MARPEDTGARGAARAGSGYDQDYDDQGFAQRRDPRQRVEPPLRAPGAPPQQPPLRQPAAGAAPQFAPFVPGQPGPAGPRGPSAAPQGRPPMPQAGMAPRPGYAPDPNADPYAQQRAPQGRPAAAPQPPQAYGAANPTLGRPGQTQRPPVPGYPPQPGYAQQQPPLRSPAQMPQQQASYDPVPPSGRVREPFFEAPPSARQTVPPTRRPAGGVAQDGYGQESYTESSADDAPFDEEDEDDDEEYQDEAPKRSRRGMMLGAILVTAVVMGGALGYVYKIAGGHSHSASTPIVVAADQTPVKAAPADAVADQGGDAGKKTILERADGMDANAAGATAPGVVPSQEAVAVAGDQAPAGADAVAGPRKVATVVVKPGEKIAPGSAAAAADGQPVDAVPGISVDVPADPASKPAVKAKTAAAQAPAAPAQDAAAADAQPADGAAPAAADPAAQPLKLGKTTKKMKLASAAPVAAPAAPADAGTDAAASDGTDAVPADPTLAPAPKTKMASVSKKAVSGSGYLIQVRSTKTQADALAFFADLQQRFSDLLGQAQPDIQEADLGDKGKWYRLRIGPPGSGAAAKDLCVKLKAAGLKDCIVAPY